MSGNINNIFDWLNEITYYKRSWETFNQDEKDLFNIFLINRFISMDPNYVDVVNLIQRYPNCSNKMVYKFYCDLLPKKKSFFRYIKAKSKFETETINKISEYYQCSTREAKEYISILNDDEVENILNVGTSSKPKKRRK